MRGLGPVSKTYALRVHVSELQWRISKDGPCRAGATQRHGPAFAISLRRKEHQMLDIAMLALGLVFFVATIAYVYACDRL